MPIGRYEYSNLKGVYKNGMCDYTEKSERKQRKKCENSNKAVLKNIL